METHPRYEGTRNSIRTHWPLFVALYGSVVVAMLLIGVGFVREWYAFVPFALAIIVVAAYFLLANFWAVHHLYDTQGARPIDVLYRMSQTRPTHQIAYVDLGTRSGAIFVARRLTTGVVHDIDIYNPESTPSATLRRRRRSAPRAPHDPRLRWLDGTAALLPLADKSMNTIFLDAVWSEFIVPEERQMLLAEARRILAPDGRLVLAERLKSQTNLLVLGPGYFALPAESELKHALHRAGFDIERTEILHGMVWCLTANKPNPGRARQLALNLEYR